LPLKLAEPRIRHALVQRAALHLGHQARLPDSSLAGQERGHAMPRAGTFHQPL